MDEGSMAEYYDQQSWNELPQQPRVFDDEDGSNSAVAAVPVEFRTGAAGTGKTYDLRKMIEEDPKAGLLCATTGVAAVNLDTITINSVLSYFDTASLVDKYITGKLTRKLVSLREEDEIKSLFIDEVSMLSADQLDTMYQAAAEANARLAEKGIEPLGITLTGDFCQLPPIKERWAFQGQAWEHFAKNIIRKTKIWRQSDPAYLNALNLARSGQGPEAAEAFRPIARWAAALNNDFDGTTIMAKNDDVERYNRARYIRLAGAEKEFKSSRWGKQRPEWRWDETKGKGIPEILRLKKGAYVMILANNPPAFTYANGDCGWVEDFALEGVRVKLKRNGNVVTVPYITRHVEDKEEPTGRDAEWARWDATKGVWVLGAITYMPIRLAYAATVHKTQGLTLDNVQIDIRGHFFGAPNMAYVALSRARSADGLRIVGSPELLARRIVLAPEVLPWV